MAEPKHVEPVIRISAPVGRQTGLGDVIKKMASVVGIDPCRGCQQRAVILNRWVGFKSIGEKS